jgi:hypothetical protein
MHHHKQLVHIPRHAFPKAVPQVTSLLTISAATVKTNVSSTLNKPEQGTSRTTCSLRSGLAWENLISTPRSHSFVPRERSYDVYMGRGGENL